MSAPISWREQESKSGKMAQHMNVQVIPFKCLKNYNDIVSRLVRLDVKKNDWHSFTHPVYALSGACNNCIVEKAYIGLKKIACFLIHLCNIFI